MVEQGQWDLHTGEYIGEISALCFVHLPPDIHSLPYLIAGTGSQILLYDLVGGQVVTTIQVFLGIRVHGITCSLVSSTIGSSSCTLTFKVAVFGERRVKLLSLCFEMALGSQKIPLQVTANLRLFHLLPKFSNWVLDVCFLKALQDEISSLEESFCIAIGCSDNSVCLWDMLKSSVTCEIKSPDRCLLYSMRLWGEKLDALHVASGTIYNEIIVWQVVPHDHRFEALHICRLSGHEGSIFRIAWSADGSKLVSASDDRSARIWAFDGERRNSDEVHGLYLAGPVLFGHNARIWDCCISDSLIVTAGEDCTCRVWGMDGSQLKIIKEHTGRGIWRFLYNPESSLLVTAGFDSTIKLHQLQCFLLRGSDGHGEIEEFSNRKANLAVSIPNSSEHIGLMDSKSEYVRCLRFTSEESLYVATNQGYLYHAKLCETEEVKWTKLVRVGEGAPIVCMDLLTQSPLGLHSGTSDWVAVGDGKGGMTVVRFIDDACSHKVGQTLTWSAEQERQLLGAYWSTALGCSHIFTADPRGMLKLWRLSDSLRSGNSVVGSNDVLLVAEFISCFAARIMCLDVSVEEEVLVCGDLRGNLVLFPLLKGLLLGTPGASEKTVPLNHFKGAHGISSVSSISITSFRYGQIEIRSTGSDGCICYLEYDSAQKSLEFIGMKQVKELSLIQSVSPGGDSADDLTCASYAIGFASADFIIWNIITNTKVVQVPCGGWRRPHSYYLGDVAEMMNCFAYVKDELIYVHRHWVPDCKRKSFPQILHMQFHGREMHTLRFISEDSLCNTNGEHSPFYRSGWIATGCEDGTVRLTRYASGAKKFSSSKLLGEHVGGSAVRSICFVSKIHIISTDVNNLPDKTNRESTASEDREVPTLLISVGAKRVLTSWLLKERRCSKAGNGIIEPSLGRSSSVSFQWLSSDMPTKCSGTHKKMENIDKLLGDLELKHCLGDKYENDWRYLSVTAFLVKRDFSRLTVCFVVIACSDATLALRALVLPNRFWYDVASLIPVPSPILALQHIIISKHVVSRDNIHDGNLYIVIGGSTEGSITFWDLTESVEAFMGQLSTLQLQKSIEYHKRPRTGRGSQGGRWWRLLGSTLTNKQVVNSVSTESCSRAVNMETYDSLSEVFVLRPLLVLSNIHQSGVNCLHVSDFKERQSFGHGFLYNLLSGGDDQAIHCLTFDLSVLPTSLDSILEKTPEMENCIFNFRKQNYGIRILYHDRIASAHSSAIKGIWTDGTWVFSTGLDQRVRCWCIEDHSKLTEHSQLIISVPEPEALDATTCGKNHYNIAVAGRGMQLVVFSASSSAVDRDTRYQIAKMVGFCRGRPFASLQALRARAGLFWASALSHEFQPSLIW